MQQSLAFVTWRMRGEYLPPKTPQILEPGTEVCRQLLVDFVLELLGNCRTLTCRGDRDLEITASNYRSKIEVAMRRIIHAVDENPALNRLAIDGRIHFGDIRSGDDDEVAVEVCWLELPLDPFEPAFVCKPSNLRFRFRRDYAQVQSRNQEAIDLFEPHVSGAYQQSRSSIEFQKNRQQAHGDLSPRPRAARGL